MPGAGGESGATWAGPLPVTCVKRSDCGRGGGEGGSGSGGVVALGVLGGEAGLVGWLLFIDQLPSSSTPEPNCTGGRDDTLGQISSSLIWKASVPG